jgi:PadR family transcriptional regulator AphA
MKGVAGMALKHGILGLLNYGEMTGYEVMKTFEKSLNYFWHVRTSQIYLELDNMAKSGLVVFRKEIQENRPNKNIFMITEKGREELRNWMSQYDMKKFFNMKNEFLMIVFFLNELPKDEVLKILEDYKKQCIEERDSLKNAKDTVQIFKDIYSINKKDHIFWSLTVKHGEFSYDACLKWADYAIKTIKKEL